MSDNNSTNNNNTNTPNYESKISEISSRRQPSAIRALQPLLSIPGMISLGGGLPNPSTFPFQSLEFTLKDGTKISLSDEEIKAALQYCPTSGLPSFLSWVKEHQKTIHSPPYENWEVCVSTGSQDSLAKAFQALLNPGDSILLEIPTYSGALSALKPMNCNLCGVPTDHGGIVIDELRQMLKNWDTSLKPFPKALYTIPTGQNPSGATLDINRRQDLYNLMSEYDIIILEDDPYFYMMLEDNNEQNNDTKPNHPKSFLSLDVDARVLRFDSLSKILSSGMRLGWVTGPPVLVQRIQLHMQSESLHTSAMSQTIAAALLNAWGLEGFYKHIRSIQQFYKDRRNLFLAAAEKHLLGLADWSTPSAGMFVWFTLKNIKDSKQLIEQKARDKKVLLVPGQVFHPENISGPYVRAAYSVASEEDMNVALERFSQVLKESQ
eukprot:gb/GECH01014129.1/.p1 GENE.gb/GECH01014129.1/~~gb/GECH01014129.1/.p1  ORF type:complete len:435 (+),score=116.56 gb/GECH01014129.1/:1-1305(+)